MEITEAIWGPWGPLRAPSRGLPPALQRAFTRFAGGPSEASGTGREGPQLSLRGVYTP